MSNHRHYKARDYQFGLQALQAREKAGLTQAEVATSLHVSERTIQYWEGGSSRPTPANLRKLIAFYVAHGAFTPEHERDEARELWKQGCLRTAHWQLAFDENWFITLLNVLNGSGHPAVQETALQTISSPQPEERSSFLSDGDAGPEQPISPSSTPSPHHTLDWGEATDISTFYGRDQELAELEDWILTDQCRLVTLLGMGGIGKTVLSVKIAHHIAPQFDFVLWRSLRNVPPFEEVIADCVQFLSMQQHTRLPPNSEKCITLLIDLLREKRCLLVFDNIDALLRGGERQGCYREGCEEYGVLVQRIAETSHQSCLLLTSREMLTGLSLLNGTDSPVRAFKLIGLGPRASQQMLKDKGLFGGQEAWLVLVERYGGNPLALKIVAEAVRELFGGDIAAFLQEGYVLFHDILFLLNHQFERLSALEQDLMYWLAIERDPVSWEELSANFIHTPPKGAFLDALQSLRRRCLIERGERAAVFTLQPVVLEYVTERLIRLVAEEITHGHFTLLVKYPLMKGQAKDYLRNSQIRLLLQPVLKRLVAHLGSESELEHHLIMLLTCLRVKPHMAQGYGGGNIVNLLAQLRGHIRGIDCSNLLIRQAYLQGIEAQDASFVGADLTNSVFMETFDSIAAVALSQDGKYLATGSFNGQICVWQVAAGKPLLALKGHIRMVWSVAFSPDSTLLASGSYDRTIKLWEVKSGRTLQTLNGHSEWVRSVAFHPDGHLLASSADDATIRLWNIEDGTCLHVLEGHSDAIWSIAFHPDGNMLVSGSMDKTVKLWDVASGACLETLHTYAEQIVSVAFSHDGKLIVSGGEGRMRIWERHNLQQLTTLSSGPSWIWSLAFTSDGTLMSSDDESVILWDTSSGQRLRTLQDHQSHNSRVWSIAFAAENLLASGSYNGRVKLWDTSTGHCLRTFQGYNRVICTLAFSPDGRILVSGDDQGIVQIWEVRSGHCLTTWQGHSGRVWSLVFRPDGETFVTGGNDRGIKIWDALTGRYLKTLSGHTEVIWSLAFSPDGSMLASGSLDRTIKLWKITQPSNDTCLRTLQASNWIWSLTFSPDGSLLASGSADGAVEIWDVVSGTCLNTLRSSTSPIGSVTFCPDGKTLASSSNDEMVCLWEVESGQCLKTTHGVGNANWVKSVAFNSEGTMLATGCNDRTIKLWNVNNEQDTRVLTRHDGGIWSVAFSSDDTILASGGDDGVILLWILQADNSCKRLCSDRPFERMDISGAVGLTQAQKASLEVLGAIENATEKHVATFL